MDLQRVDVIPVCARRLPPSSAAAPISSRPADGTCAGHVVRADDLGLVIADDDGPRFLQYRPNVFRRALAAARRPSSGGARQELALEERAQRAVEDERARISRELHDVIAHSVSVMTVQASAVRRLLQPEQEREREALLVVEETGRQALTEMRRLLGILREEGSSPERAPQPGIATLEALVEDVRQAGLPVVLTVEGEPLRLPPGVDLSAYRIVQEALTNALRHAGPAHAWVAVRYGGDDVEIEVANDGRSDGERGQGQSLVGMRERVALVGGELTAGPRKGGGFSISARLPVGGAS